MDENKTEFHVCNEPHKRIENQFIDEKLFLISKVFENSNNAVGITDSRRERFFHNNALNNLFGYAPEELKKIGGGPAIYANKDVAQEVFNTIKEGKAWQGEVEMITKSGRKLIIDLRADAIKDLYGKVIGLIGIHIDITQRKKELDAIQNGKKWFYDLTKYMAVGMYEVNFETGYFKIVNDILCDYTGYTKHELLNIDFYNLLTKDSYETLCERREILNKGGAVSPIVEYSFKTKNGEEMRCFVNNHFIYENGKLKSALGFVQHVVKCNQRESEQQKIWTKPTLQIMKMGPSVLD